MFLGLWPCRSRSPIPSLAPSWWSPCSILQRASMTVSCCVLRVPSAFVYIGLVLSIPFASSPLSHRVLDAVSILYTRSILRLGRLTLRWVPSEPMGFVVAPPISPYTGPVSLRSLGVRHLGLRFGNFLLLPARHSACIQWRSFLIFLCFMHVPA